MKTFGKVLYTTTLEWKQEIYQFLPVRNYHTIAHCTTGVVPATTLFGRLIIIRVKLPNSVVVPSGESHDPPTMCKRDAQQKLKIMQEPS